MRIGAILRADAERDGDTLEVGRRRQCCSAVRRGLLIVRSFSVAHRVGCMPGVLAYCELCEPGSLNAATVKVISPPEGPSSRSHDEAESGLLPDSLR